MRDHESLYAHVRAKNDLDNGGMGQTARTYVVALSLMLTVGENLVFAPYKVELHDAHQTRLRVAV